MLNAVGLHPVDRVAYGLMKFADETTYLVRFDHQDVAFLARVPDSPAGTVAAAGSVLWGPRDGWCRSEDGASRPGFGPRSAAAGRAAGARCGAGRAWPRAAGPRGPPCPRPTR